MTDPRIAAKYPGHVPARLADKLLTKVIAGCWISACSVPTGLPC
jgi:hypothetical protein